MNIDSQHELSSGEQKNDPILEELCLNMLERAALTRTPGDQITVGAAGCNLAAVVHFIEPGSGEEYADWLELLEVRKARAESAGEPGIPLEQVIAELAREVDPEL